MSKQPTTIYIIETNTINVQFECEVDQYSPLKKRKLFEIIAGTHMLHYVNVTNYVNVITSE